jgi:flavin-dependent dehydrogenase
VSACPSSSTKYDVAVVGAGPAGLATAIGCAEAGLNVCVLERGRFPRIYVGEAVHPGAEALFRRLGIAANVEKSGFLRFDGIWVESEQTRSFVRFGGSKRNPWKGFQLWRHDFDQILLSRARELGASFLGNCQVSDVRVSSRGVEVITGLGDFDVRVVVDGTGRNRFVARRWGLKVETLSRPLVAWYGYRSGDCTTRRANPLFAHTRDGWDWIARVRSDLYQWISLRFAEGKPRFTGVPPEVRELQETGCPRAADVTWRFVPECASPRHFLVGDAAAVLDPSSSHGIVRALASGILAASCIDKLLNASSGDHKSIALGYCSWQKRWFERDASRLNDLNNWSTGVPAYIVVGKMTRPSGPAGPGRGALRK